MPISIFGFPSESNSNSGANSLMISAGGDPNLGDIVMKTGLKECFEEEKITF